MQTLLFYPIKRLLKKKPKIKKSCRKSFSFCKEKEKMNLIEEIQKVYKVGPIINNPFK